MILYFWGGYKLSLNQQLIYVEQHNTTKSNYVANYEFAFAEILWVFQPPPPQILKPSNLKIPSHAYDNK